MTTPSQVKAQEAVDSLRAESRTLLRHFLGIREGESNGQVERLLDCIHSAAVLDSIIILTRTLKETP